MTYEKFEKLINNLQEITDRSRQLYSTGLDLVNFEGLFHTVINSLLEEQFGEKEEWISWYCYENDFGRGDLEAWDKDKNPICEDIRGLYKLVNEEETPFESNFEFPEDFYTNRAKYFVEIKLKNE